MASNNGRAMGSGVLPSDSRAWGWHWEYLECSSMPRSPCLFPSPRSSTHPLQEGPAYDPRQTDHPTSRGHLRDTSRAVHSDTSYIELHL
jgi:hypothetical protein